VLGNLQVLFVALAAWVLLRERPGRRFLVALPVVMTRRGAGLRAGRRGRGRQPPSRPGSSSGSATSLAYTAFLLILRQDLGRPPRIVAGPLAEVHPPSPRSARCCSASRSAVCSWTVTVAVAQVGCCCCRSPARPLGVAAHHLVPAPGCPRRCPHSCWLLQPRWPPWASPPPCWPSGRARPSWRAPSWSAAALLAASWGHPGIAQGVIARGAPGRSASKPVR